jgi:hypothetical protein
MRLRLFGFSFAFLLGGFVPCRAQLPSGPATLEKLVNEDGPASSVQPAADANQPAAESDRLAARPQGTLVRPRDGVQHPDLDRAWADYDGVVNKVTEDIRAAITKLFDAAAAEGDLDAAERWQAALDRFSTDGRVPAEGAMNAIASNANSEIREAKDKLAEAYEAVVKVLTIEKNLSLAKTVRAESLSIQKASTDTGDPGKPRPSTGKGAGFKKPVSELRAPYNLAREGRPSASRTDPGNGALGLAFDGITNDTDKDLISYWFAGHEPRQPDRLRVDLKYPASITQVRLLAPVGQLRWLGGHEPMTYEVFGVRNNREQRLARVVDARHPQVAPLAGKHNVRWIVIELPQPVVADAVVLAVAKASGGNTGPVIFEFEVIGNYTADK